MKKIYLIRRSIPVLMSVFVSSFKIIIKACSPKNHVHALPGRAVVCFIVVHSLSSSAFVAIAIYSFQNYSGNWQFVLPQGDILNFFQ